MPGFRDVPSGGVELDPTKEYWVYYSYWEDPSDAGWGLIEVDRNLGYDQVKRLVVDQWVNRGMSREEGDAYFDPGVSEGWIDLEGPFRLPGRPSLGVPPTAGGGRWPARTPNEALKRKLLAGQ